jgi:hypothetical protein
MNTMDAKSLRLTADHNTPTPADINEQLMELARVSMASYTTTSSSVEVMEQEQHEEQNQNSIQVVKRKNPQVGRTVKPQR